MPYQVGPACYETAQQANAAAASAQAGSHLAFGSKVVAVSVQAVSDASITYHYTDASQAGSTSTPMPAGEWIQVAGEGDYFSVSVESEARLGISGAFTPTKTIQPGTYLCRLTYGGDTTGLFAGEGDPANGWRKFCEARDAARTGTASTGYSVVVASTPMPCGLLTAGDGVQIGWQVAAAWLAVYALLFMTRGLRGTDGNT